MHTFLRRTATKLLLPLTTVLLLLSFVPVHATVVIDDWALQLVERSDPAKPGEPTRLVLDLLSREDIQAEVLSVSAEKGWQNLSYSMVENPSEKVSLPGYQRQRFTITGVLGETDVPLHLRLRINGQEIDKSLEFTRPVKGVAAVRVPDGSIPAPTATQLQVGGPETLSVDGQAQLDGSSQKSTTIRVRGVIALRRSDGSVIGADRVKVKIQDDEGSYSNGLVEGITDALGGFDLSFSWNYGVLIDPEPDLVVSVELSNDHVDVRSTSIVSGNYSFEVFREDDFVGPFDLNLGTLVPTDPMMNGAMYIHTVIERAHRWFYYRGYDMPHRLIRWPADDSFYRPLTSVVFIARGDEWDEGTLGHEYTHAWVNVFGAQETPDYCNGFCNGDVDECQHCVFCQESTDIAWSEGFPDFVTQAMNAELNTDYGAPTLSLGVYRTETIRPCTELPGGSAIDDPFLTEGIFAAFCLDMFDTSQDNDPAFSTTWRDVASIDPETLLDVAANYDPRYVQDFLDALEAHMKMLSSYDDQDIEDLWETAQNNGYEIDDMAPSVVTNLGSNTHSAGVSSPANLPQFYWNTAQDDASGIMGYAVSLTAGAPSMPSASMDIGRVNNYTVDTPVVPGTYYFNIRALDRSGKWSTAYANFGPIVIGPAEPVDLAPHVPEFWSDALVCLSAGEGNTSYVPEPTTLPGFQSGTQVFYAYKNFSTSSLSHDGFKTGFCFDGTGSWIDTSVPAGVLVASQEFIVGTSSSLQFPGGRHTVNLYIDRGQDIGESYELNNFYTRQFVWTPYLLEPGISHVNTHLTRKDGGFDYLSGPHWYNADGYRMQLDGTSWWHAAVVNPTQAVYDVDIRMYTATSSGALDGFDTISAYSSRGTGLLDAVFVNRNYTGTVDHDVGVLTGDTSQPYSSYLVRQVGSVLVAYDGSFSVDFGPNEYMALREVNVDADHTGLFSVIVTVADASEPVAVGWLDKDFSTGDMSDLSHLVVSDEEGVAQLDVDVSASGYYCIVIYREPFGSPSAKTDLPLNLSVTTGATPPNLLASDQVKGWAGPLIPRPAADGAPSSVPEPTYLIGEGPQTWLNLAQVNDAPASAGTSSASIRLDGESVRSVATPGLAPGALYTYNDPNPISVRGGRHLLSVRVDDTQVVDEASEADNIFADQWVWEPGVLPSGSEVARNSPPAAAGGFDDIVYVETVNSESAEGSDVTVFPEVGPNCDGLRLPLPAPAGEDGYWLAMATMPDLKTNVDLRLHEASTGPRDGFLTPLAGSFEGPGRSDYVLVDFREEAARFFDVGVLRAGNGTAPYLAESVASTWLGNSPEGVFGPYTIAELKLLNLHEVHLDPGVWSIAVEDLSGTTHYGLALHGGASGSGTPALYGPTDTPEGGHSVLSNPGELLSIQADIEPGEEGYYCIAVRKLLTEDTATNAQYKLHITKGSTAAPSTPAARDAAHLRGVHPNPFNPRTTVELELPRSERVVLEVYDPRGRRVRTLLDEVRAAGHHEVVFDGVDEDGRGLASGTYFVRLTTPDGVEVKKASLLK